MLSLRRLVLCSPPTVHLLMLLAIPAGVGNCDRESEPSESGDDDDDDGDDDDSGDDDDDVGDDDDDDHGTYEYAPCPWDSHLGDVRVEVSSKGYTRIEGVIEDGLDPSSIPIELGAAGACKLLTKRALDCDPPCGVGEMCMPDGSCAPEPEAFTFGDVSIDGMVEPVELEVGPGGSYRFTGTLPFPAFGVGDDLILRASGGAKSPFELLGVGLGVPTLDEVDVPVEADKTTTVEWTPESGGAHMVVSLNVNNHGHGWHWIECVVPDEMGSVDIRAELVTQLIDAGLSGYPNIRFIRHSVDSTNVGPGCVGFSIESEVERAVTIPGLVSCSDSSQCPDGQECLPDLTCG